MKITFPSKAKIEEKRNRGFLRTGRATHDGVSHIPPTWDCFIEALHFMHLDTSVKVHLIHFINNVVRQPIVDISKDIIRDLRGGYTLKYIDRKNIPFIPAAIHYSLDRPNEVEFYSQEFLDMVNRLYGKQIVHDFKQHLRITWSFVWTYKLPHFELFNKG